jgi:hypothetical protein
MDYIKTVVKGEDDEACFLCQAAASTTDDERKFAIEALLDTAVRELSFGGKTERLPGL